MCDASSRSIATPTTKTHLTPLYVKAKELEMQTQFKPAQFDIKGYLNEARLGIHLQQIFQYSLS